MCKAECIPCVCTCVCAFVCNPRAHSSQVALLKGAKWRLWLGFDKWPFNTKATFANFGDKVEGEVTGVKELCLCVCAQLYPSTHNLCLLTDGVRNGLILLQSCCQMQSHYGLATRLSPLRKGYNHRDDTHTHTLSHFLGFVFML